MPEDSTESDRLGRDGILELLDAAALEAHRKVESGRVRDAENEKVRQGWIRVLAYVAGQYRQLERDERLKALSDRVEELETMEEIGTADGIELPEPEGLDA